MVSISSQQQISNQQTKIALLRTISIYKRIREMVTDVSLVKKLEVLKNQHFRFFLLKNI